MKSHLELKELEISLVILKINTYKSWEKLKNKIKYLNEINLIIRNKIHFFYYLIKMFI